jgi:uncharacterized membrane protein YbhN (UPF0104 family)
MGLSILRYGVVFSRILIVLWVLGMSAYAGAAVIASPLLQIMVLVPITPGNLGITEWTWSAILVSAGATASAAALFVLTMRILNLVAQLIVLLLILGYRLFRSGWLRRARMRLMPLPLGAKARSQARYEPVE